MLVLSRRLDEKILLPTVPALIKVISSHAGLIRLGIEAPAHVPILREELTHTERGLPMGVPEETGEPLAPQIVRTRVNNLLLSLTMLRMHLVDCGPVVSKTLDAIDAELQALRRSVRATQGQTETVAV